MRLLCVKTKECHLPNLNELAFPLADTFVYSPLHSWYLCLKPHQVFLRPFQILRKLDYSNSVKSPVCGNVTIDISSRSSSVLSNLTELSVQDIASIVISALACSHRLKLLNVAGWVLKNIPALRFPTLSNAIPLISRSSSLFLSWISHILLFFWRSALLVGFVLVYLWLIISESTYPLYVELGSGYSPTTDSLVDCYLFPFQKNLHTGRKISLIFICKQRHLVAAGFILETPSALAMFWIWLSRMTLKPIHALMVGTQRTPCFHSSSPSIGSINVRKFFRIALCFRQRPLSIFE